jgi:AmmeMemoRadiSam system protein B
MIRNPVVHGRFYPAEPVGLKAMVESFVSGQEQKEEALGLLCPHAGYVFSGAVAGKAFGAVRVPDTVLLLNPSHAYDRPALAVWTGGDWHTPLGTAALHEGLTAALADCPLTVADNRPHMPEHSGEVVVPFIQVCNPQARIAVVCVTLSAGLQVLKDFGQAVPGMLSTCGAVDALVVASSDMSHERGPRNLEVVRSHDALAVAEMEKLDPDGLYKACRDNNITMCGRLPAVAMMASVIARGGSRGKLMARATSADSPHGGGDYVVGYAGMVFA